MGDYLGKSLPGTGTATAQDLRQEGSGEGAGVMEREKDMRAGR